MFSLASSKLRRHKKNNQSHNNERTTTNNHQPEFQLKVRRGNDIDDEGGSEEPLELPSVMKVLNQEWKGVSRRTL